LGLIGISLLYLWISQRGSWPIAASFLGGIITAFVVTRPRLRSLARHPAASVACLAALAASTRFSTPFSPAPLLLLTTAFAIIACGNTLFGALEWAVARGLGDMGYSVYLLHGLVLFAAFGIVLGPVRTAALSPLAHWTMIWACTPVVVTLSFATFRLIEAPAMIRVDRVNALMAP
jgi:peptidoglycan/LPS O-acetylase OafA/YrhL